MLATIWRLYVFESRTLQALEWSEVLVVHASKGFQEILSSMNRFWIYEGFWKQWDNKLRFFRISYGRTTLASCCGRYLVFKQQLCASLALMNPRKSCGMHLSMRVCLEFLLLSINSNFFTLFMALTYVICVLHILGNHPGEPIIGTYKGQRFLTYLDMFQDRWS